MTAEFFITGFGFVLALFMGWGFRVLPQEKWQILCTVPKTKQGRDCWLGVNFTFYGLFNANSVVLSAGLFFLLLASINIPLLGIFIILSALLTVCIPASKLVARIVEKKPSTLSVGGASFIGFLMAPWAALIVSLFVGKPLGFHLPVLPVMALLAISYAFGEGMGRLSCISFGCCYGKPLSQVHPLLQRFFQKWYFVFEGKTKKISYADGFDGQKVIPIQAVTAIIYCSVGLVGLYLFLKGNFKNAFLVTAMTIQVWRFTSEFLRADYRGKGKISPYQAMGLAMVVYAFFISAIFAATETIVPSLDTGFKALWHPAVILFLQVLWIIIFIFTGKSKVTASTLSFYVVHDKI
jgi:hypothetical protein